MTTSNTSYLKKLEKQYGTLSFGNMLKAWREADGLTQAGFARKLKLSAQNLNDLEKGRRIPSATRAAKIARKLGISEIGAIQLAMRDALTKEGFRFDVKLEEAS